MWSAAFGGLCACAGSPWPMTHTPGQPWLACLGRLRPRRATVPASPLTRAARGCRATGRCAGAGAAGAEALAFALQGATGAGAVAVALQGAARARRVAKRTPPGLGAAAPPGRSRAHPGSAPPRGPGSAPPRGRAFWGPRTEAATHTPEPVTRSTAPPWPWAAATRKERRMVRIHTLTVCSYGLG